MKVLSLAAALGSVIRIFKKQKPVSRHTSETEVEYFEEKDPPPGFVDFSGGTLGI